MRTIQTARNEKMDMKQICRYCQNRTGSLLDGKSYCMHYGSEVLFTKCECSDFVNLKLKMALKLN